MQEKIKELLNEVEAFKAESKEQLEDFRIQILGSKGKIKGLFAAFKNVPNDQRKEVGQLINTLKEKAQDKLDEFKEILVGGENATADDLDLTRTGTPVKLGSRHPISIVRNEIIDIFSRIGFTVSEGPEVEDDWHNFSALNFPPEHPARE
jgi:phenylalanyl-tRNA synthetase alpha chain